MSVTLADLDSRCYLSLKPAGEYIDLDQMHNAVLNRVNVRTMQSRYSTTNVLLATTPEFIPDTTPYDITALIGKSTPCWLEYRQFNGDLYPGWQTIRIVPLSQLGEYQALGSFAASFHGDETTSTTAQAVQYLSFTYLPEATCRIRFDRDSERIALDGSMLLPDNLADLIVREAQNDAIPSIKLAITMNMRRDPVLRQDGPAIIATLSEVYQQNLVAIRDMERLWQIWAFIDRARESNFNKPSPSGRRLYGDGWGGFTGGGY